MPIRTFCDICGEEIILGMKQGKITVHDDFNFPNSPTKELEYVCSHCLYAFHKWVEQREAGIRLEYEVKKDA